MDPVADNICALCGEEFQPAGVRGVLPCEHEFHQNCVVLARRDNQSDLCPIWTCKERFNRMTLRYPPNVRRTAAMRQNELQEIFFPEPEKCALCEVVLATTRQGTYARLSNDCLHKFCVDCIRNWTRNQNPPHTCPMCRIPYDGQIRIMYPPTQRLTRAMAAREGLVPLNVERARHDPVHPTGRHDPLFDDTLPRPPERDRHRADWEAWCNRHGHDSWFAFLNDNALCQVCFSVEDPPPGQPNNRLIRCDLCGYFWHRVCAETNYDYYNFVNSGPHEIPDPENDDVMVWACGQCAGRDHAPPDPDAEPDDPPPVQENVDWNELPNLDPW